jgi:hypothetical protein
MANSLSQFSRRIRAVGKRVEVNTDKLTRQVALVADQTVVLSTPVDEGRARSNWIVSLGSPALSEREPYAPGSKLGLSEGGNASGAIAQGQGVIAARKSGQDIFISNNVPYISDLNNGTSAQAPANFVEKAVQVAVSAIRGARITR